MKVEIISIGDELLIGQVVNTNASKIAEMLFHHGFEVGWISTVKDSTEAISEALRIAEQRAGLVISTGGLGPTSDDRTKAALLEYFGGTLILDKEQYQHVEVFFKRRNLPLLESNRMQAWMPDSAERIPNETGTAAGMKFVKHDTVFFFLPGVPFEMINIMNKEILPWLKASFKPSVRYHKTLLTFGPGESFLAEKIADIETALPENMALAYLPSPQRVRLRLTAQGDDAEALQGAIVHYANQIKNRIPDLIFGEDDQTMEQVTGRLLKEGGYTVSTAESCTGGMIAELLTSIPGSSDYFKGSVVAYSNDIKQSLLEVDPQLLHRYGAVSEPVVLQMAQNVQKLMNTDFALAVSGIAGPGGGSEEKPVGTVWLAVASPARVFAVKKSFGSDRKRNMMRAAYTALNLLRIEINNQIILLHD